MFSFKFIHLIFLIDFNYQNKKWYVILGKNKETSSVECNKNNKLIRIYFKIKTLYFASLFKKLLTSGFQIKLKSK